jgi:hypothetical protein
MVTMLRPLSPLSLNKCKIQSAFFNFLAHERIWVVTIVTTARRGAVRAARYAVTTIRGSAPLFSRKIQIPTFFILLGWRRQES